MDNKELDKQLLKLQDTLCCGFLDAALFKAAFDVTKIAKNKSYRNQRLAVVGDAALKLLFTRRLYGADKTKKDISEQRTVYESDENWIKVCNCFNLLKYRFADGNGADTGLRNYPGSKAVKAAFFEAVAGSIYLDCGLEKLGEWYDELQIKRGKELSEYGFMYLSLKGCE